MKGFPQLHVTETDGRRREREFQRSHDESRKDFPQLHETEIIEYNIRTEKNLSIT
jgi:hypothetical protein